MWSDEFDQTAELERVFWKCCYIERDRIHRNTTNNRQARVAIESRAFIAQSAEPTIGITDRNGCNPRRLACYECAAVTDCRTLIDVTHLDNTR
jgi:hypothetical protein